MTDTSVSLLDQLRLAPDNEAWSRLVEIYTPLIRGWLTRQGLLAQDADDLTQQVLMVLVRRLPQFERKPRAGAFRRWLKSITVNCLRDHWGREKNRPRGTGDTGMQDLMDQLADPDSGQSQEWDREHDQYMTRKLLEMIRPGFEARTWEAFRRFALDGEEAEKVAAALGMTVNAVFIAKSRVLSRLRQEGAGLID